MQYLARPDGDRVAFCHTPGASPGIMFCAGFHSDMQGDKALALQDWCERHGRQYTRFDYFGHGRSSGLFESGTIGRWKDDTLAILDEVSDGPQVLVGSSMGGWMMLLAALARPEQVVGLVGIAVAPDFIRDMRNARLGPQMLADLEQQGYCELPNGYDDGEPYIISRTLLEEAEQHCLLEGPLPIQKPIRLLHGMRDESVPPEKSLKVMALAESSDVVVQLIKDGDHRLSRPADLHRLCETLQELILQIDERQASNPD